MNGQKPARPVPHDIVMLPITESTSIAAIGYDGDSKILRVAFMGRDRIYDYFDVPPDEARDFFAAESHGKYHVARIKYGYDCQPYVPPAPPAAAALPEGSQPK